MGNELLRDERARILVVEDNDDFRLLMEFTLRNEGYRVDSASCAEDAFHLLNANDYQLVLSDYSLPAHSGAWLLSKAQQIRGAVAFVFITGDPDAPGIPHDAVVIPKPPDFEWLLVAIQRMLKSVSERLAIGVRSGRRVLHASPTPCLNPSTSA